MRSKAKVTRQRKQRNGDNVTSAHDKELHIRRDYEILLPRHTLLAASSHTICRTLLEAKDIPFHSVKSRVKAYESVIDKIDRKKYPDLSAVTDLVGVRVVCLYKQHIDPVASLLQTEFDIVERIDKRPDHDPGRFGYSSLHLLCRLQSNRTGLVEYSSINSLIFEVQIRTILQEAWAEIEHRMIYKKTEEAPANIRREIARTAAMLESADASFDEAYNRHKEYLTSLSQKDTRTLEQEPLNVSSLLELIRREMPWADEWDRHQDASATTDNLLLDLREQGIVDVLGLAKLLSKWTTTVDAENRAKYFSEKRDDKPFLAHGDIEWAHRTKRYFNPIGVIRAMLKHEFPDFVVKTRSP